MTRSILVLVDARPPRWVARAIAEIRAGDVDVRIEREPCDREGVCARVVRACAGTWLRPARIEDESGTARPRIDLCIDLRRGARARCATRPERCETWYFEFGNERDGVPAFDDGLHAAQSVEVRLVAHRGIELRELQYGRFPYASRIARTIDRIFEECVHWLRREVTHPTAQERSKLLRAPEEPHGKIGPIDLACFLGREAVRFAGHALRHAFEEARWDVAVTNASIERFVADPRAAWLHWVARDDREYLADPFLMRSENGRATLLCETMIGVTTGLIAIDLDDRFGERRPLLNGAGPASYPYVVDIGNESWLVPEQWPCGRLEAYRLEGTRTELASVLLDGVAAVDPTIVQHAGLWWLFCTDQRRGPNYVLHVYWAQDPRGPWHGHARNPVKIDIAGARPGGTPFVRNGVLYRPAQDCTGRYGRAVAIHRVDVLTPESFEESCVARIDASMLQRKGPAGVHTLSYGHGWVAIDAQFARWSLRKPVYLLKAYLAQHGRARPCAKVPVPA